MVHLLNTEKINLCAKDGYLNINKKAKLYLHIVFGRKISVFPLENIALINQTYLAIII